MKHKGIACFVVDANTPGVKPGRKENKMGHRASNTTDVLFEVRKQRSEAKQPLKVPITIVSVQAHDTTVGLMPIVEAVRTPIGKRNGWLAGTHSVFRYKNYVFIGDKDKVYNIANQDLAALKTHAGHEVEITGTMGEQRPGSAAAGAASGASNAPMATLKVDSVKMVSTTCP
jgi:hypothetical protein